MNLGFGVIEGFYGQPWSVDDRAYAAERLSELGGNFFIYAPKGDPFLRKRWRESANADAARGLTMLGRDLRGRGLSFGVGLSPYELYRAFDAEARNALEVKLREILGWGVDHLSLLFDDMRGDLPQLAELQTEIVRFVQGLGMFPRLSFCPTYYSPDPVLDRVFGPRPEGYLEAIGREIDREVNFFWTGPEICSKEYPSEHLNEVTRVLQRKPFLWDNYPVNDGQRMCKFLHLRSMAPGRPPRLREELAGHAVNPMNQARLSWIPMRTLFSESWNEAAEAELGREFAAVLAEDGAEFQDAGLDTMGAERLEILRARYSRFLPHPAAREILAWLAGETVVTRELVLTQ